MSVVFINFDGREAHGAEAGVFDAFTALGVLVEHVHDLALQARPEGHWLGVGASDVGLQLRAAPAGDRAVGATSMSISHRYMSGRTITTFGNEFNYPVAKTQSSDSSRLRFCNH